LLGFPATIIDFCQQSAPNHLHPYCFQWSVFIVAKGWQKFLWDTARMTFADNPTAQALVRPSDRKSWEFAGL
jgi:hypothetical protein